jgi:GntR family transcriptional repressor for pyruvate dehydrogenase complex
VKANATSQNESGNKIERIMLDCDYQLIITMKSLNPRAKAKGAEAEVQAVNGDGDVVHDLMEFVRQKGFHRGDRMPSIRELAVTLGHGPTVVRDGMLQAQTMGLVKIEPRLGIFVENPEAVRLSDDLSRSLHGSLVRKDQNVFHLLEARIFVEVELVGKVARAKRHEDLLPLRGALEKVLACRGERLELIEADEAFHLGIAKIAGNPVMLTFLRTLLGLLRPTKAIVLLSDKNRKRTDNEHVEIFRCLLAGDAEQAQAVMRKHLEHGRSLLLQHLRTLPGPEPDSGKARK